MTEDQLISIKRRNPGKGISENWFHIFGILFPGETPPNSPCTHFGDTLSPSEADLHIDLGDDALQNEVNDVARRFRQHAPGMLNDEIRSRLISEMDFTFREGYLLDLILHEAVSSVVQHFDNKPQFQQRGTSSAAYCDRLRTRRTPGRPVSLRRSSRSRH
jgi:hypothetical protein